MPLLLDEDPVEGFDDLEAVFAALATRFAVALEVVFAAAPLPELEADFELLFAFPFVPPLAVRFDAVFVAAFVAVLPVALADAAFFAAFAALFLAVAADFAGASEPDPAVFFDADFAADFVPAFPADFEAPLDAEAAFVPFASEADVSPFSPG